MKSLIALCVCLAATSAVADPLEVKVEVVERPINPCGVVAWQVMVRYRVISVDKGTYAGKEIYATERCPMLRAGQIRTLVLRPATANEIQVDRYRSSAPAAPRYLVVQR